MKFCGTRVATFVAVARKIYNLEPARPAPDELGRLSAIYLYAQRTKKVAVSRRRVPLVINREIVEPVKIRHAD
jgi:hypothetical protein